MPENSPPTVLSTPRGLSEPQASPTLQLLPQLATRLLAGTQLLADLGSGASSRVFLCEQGGERLALKLAAGAFTGDARSLFADEARRLIWAKSRGLPTLRGCGLLPSALSWQGQAFASGTPYLLLSLAQGEPLSRWLQRTVPREALGWAVARDIAEALRDLHDTGVAHGDVKPDNIMVLASAAGYRCTLIDLGLADSGNAEQPKGGTLAYLAPEALDAEAPSDARSRDLYALGRCLLETFSSAEDGEGSALSERARFVVRALCAKDAAARPSAAWVLEQCPNASAESESWQRRVEHSYLLQRRRELQFVERGHRLQVNLTGPAGIWLTKHIELLEQFRELLGVEASNETRTLTSLSEYQQRQWLITLVGAASLDFPALPLWSDDELAQRLLTLTSRVPPQSISYGALISGVPSQAQAHDNDPTELALQLGREAPLESALSHLERLAQSGTAHASLLLRGARALKRRHELPRALNLLHGVEGPEAELERAGILLRAGDATAAARKLGALDVSAMNSELHANCCALRARMALASGDLAAAKAALSNVTARTLLLLEAEASVALTSGNLQDARTFLEQALAYPHDAEQRARIEALFANLAQQQGDAASALRRFQSAAEHAVRALAITEEATYLIGVASTATELGQVELALSAARRSELLFDYLQNNAAAARAALSSAAAYASVAATLDATAACERTLRLAQKAKDQRCRAFAHLILADLSSGQEAREQLEAVERLLKPLRDDDRVRVEARRLRILGAPLASLWELDTLARGVAAEEQIEWWGARAEAALSQQNFVDAKVILESLGALLHHNAAPDMLGRASAFGAQLAREIGDGALHGKLLHAASDAASRLLQGAPSGLRLSLGQKPWVKLARAPLETAVSKEQVHDLATLIHGLSERESLKSLFERVLDALVLWTSVERGLLLLKAPGGRLVPRAARNISRRDLSPLQVTLSRSLAERALEQAECVVAVDAATELPALHESVHALKLRSILAVPLIARGEVLGVVYLDDRVRRGAFGPRELSWVKLLATLAAVAIKDARDQLWLRRSARKAARAERRLADTLAKRDAELEVAQRELAQTRQGSRFAYPEIVGESAAIRQLLTLLDRITPSDIPVLIHGESGSGKELVARALTKNGPRAAHPFISENCSAIPETLLESTLFGHVKGAFTGATRGRVGLFEAANRGTLFLDEIADMSLAMQAKLLRALENGEIRRVGDERSISVDVRIIAATHKNLQELVQSGRFREDLLYRLNVITVAVPALRERSEDLPLLVEHFLKKYAEGREIQLSRSALELLNGYAWPGNVRQLENETRRAVVLADAEIRPEHFSPAVQQATPEAVPDGLNLKQRLDALESQLVVRALRQTTGNQTQAAKLLGISRFGLQKMMRRLGIDAEGGARELS